MMVMQADKSMANPSSKMRRTTTPTQSSAIDALQNFYPTIASRGYPQCVQAKMPPELVRYYHAAAGFQTLPLSQDLHL
jgi:hypothetical protein